MEHAEIFELASELFKNKLEQKGEGIELYNLQTALSQLFSDDDGNLDLASILSNMNACNLSDIAGSWLGHGQNNSISSSQIKVLFNHGKISDFSRHLGISENSAMLGLTEALPVIVDNVSNSGSLLSFTGIKSGVVTGLKGLFGK